MSSYTSNPNDAPARQVAQPVKMLKYWPALIPATFSFVALVLVILSILSGHNPGMMEDYHILYFNTSTLGKSLLDNKDLRVRLAPSMPMVTNAPMLLNRYHAAPNKRFGLGDVTSVAGGAVDGVTSVAGAGVAAATSVGAEAASAVQSVAAAAESGLGHLVDEAKDALEEIVDNLADELYKKLGIQQFYSIHLTDMCFGNFTPSATATNAGFGVVNCTTPLNWTEALNLTGILNESLGVGPFQLDLADIGMVQDVVDTIDKVMKILNSCLEAILSFYILAAIFTGLSMVLCVWAVFALRREASKKSTVIVIPHHIKATALMGNLFIAWAAALFLFIGNMVTTIGGRYAVDQVREHGGDFGLYAYRGSKFLAISWAAFALVLLTAAYWTYETVNDLVQKRNGEAKSLEETSSDDGSSGRSEAYYQSG